MRWPAGQRCFKGLHPPRRVIAGHSRPKDGVASLAYAWQSMMSIRKHNP